MQELVVRSENIQRVYNWYINNKFIVNRRYQRKLVWSIEEKASFIDSIIKGYPVPLILLAEVTSNEGDEEFEIIDGMQRLNAIMSFIEGEFPVNNEYFDLEAMAESKLRKDKSLINQKTPILNREICASNIASYVLPLSIYTLSDETQIDEIFRRINSFGHHLSRQEIRQAGSLTLFSELVRTISSEVRGDASLSERLQLSSMKNISITNKELDYGINVDNVFWVEKSIIRREQVRESKDEEIIADILAYVLLNEKPGSSSSILDELYGYNTDKSKRYIEIEDNIRFIGIEKIRTDFYRVLDIIKNVLEISNKKFNNLIFGDSKLDKVPRYFQVIYLALYELIIVKNMKIQSVNELVKKLDGISKHMKISQGGGTWSAIERDNNIKGLVGILDSIFVDNLDDPAINKWSTELETLLSQASTEQTCFDFKIGVCNLGDREFNISVLKKSIKTLTAMANQSKKSIGYVIIGVADNYKDSKDIESINGTKSIKKGTYYITGCNHDIDFLGLSDDRYYQKLTQLINNEPIDEIYKSEILNNCKFITYYGKKVLVLRIKSKSEPAIYDNKYYERKGANNSEIPMKELANLFKRFH